jgi:hypothetical protein
MAMRITWERPAERIGHLQLFGLGAAIALLVARFIPVAVIFRGYWGCTLRRYTGIPCPACGLTRAFDYTAHGRFLDAFRTTPLGALVPWLCVIVVAYALLGLLWKVPTPRLQVGEREAVWFRFGFLGLVALNWVYLVATRAGPG